MTRNPVSFVEARLRRLGPAGRDAAAVRALADLAEIVLDESLTAADLPAVEHRVQQAKDILDHVLPPSVRALGEAQARARAHAPAMIELLCGLALDPTVAPETRRACALDVLNRGRSEFGR